MRRWLQVQAVPLTVRDITIYRNEKAEFLALLAAAGAPVPRVAFAPATGRRAACG
jgi:hypothetical protein